jgi:7-cyano-7-deazaguanine synthase
MSKKAVCLLSGGIDSCVTAFIAKNQGYEIFALSFRYGQQHQKEIESSKKIAKSLGVENHIIFDLNLKQIGGSSLVDENIKIPKNHKLKDIGTSIPSTYVPARNTIFLSVALAHAEVFDADAIFIGATTQDYSGYPDCRPDYIQAYQKLADIATKKTVEGKKIKIEAPLLKMKKAEIIKKGFELGTCLENTWSCYSGEDLACGRCESCLLRLKGFKDAGKKDPVKYSFYPDWYKL